MLLSKWCSHFLFFTVFSTQFSVAGMADVETFFEAFVAEARSDSCSIYLDNNRLTSGPNYGQLIRLAELAPGNNSLLQKYLGLEHNQSVLEHLNAQATAHHEEGLGLPKLTRNSNSCETLRELAPLMNTYLVGEFVYTRAYRGELPPVRPAAPSAETPSE